MSNKKLANALKYLENKIFYRKFYLKIPRVYNNPILPNSAKLLYVLVGSYNLNEGVYTSYRMAARAALKSLIEASYLDIISSPRKMNSYLKYQLSWIRESVLNYYDSNLYTIFVISQNYWPVPIYANLDEDGRYKDLNYLITNTETAHHVILNKRPIKIFL